jgi:hypothetical protein
MVRRSLWVGVVLLAAAMAPAWAGPISLEFPSSDSISGGPTGGGMLGGGGGGLHFITGDDLTETFSDTGLGSATQSHWQFSMSDFTPASVDNTFDVEINGAVVGSFTLNAAAHTGSTTETFDLLFDHAAISGPDYTLRMVATSTVPPGLSSWNWFPGGTVTLVPEPASLGLLLMGGLALIKRR